MSDLDDKTVSRFWAKVNRDGPVHPTLGTPCWLWTAAENGRGYGYFRGRPRLGTNRAHKVAWILSRGPVPTGTEIDHLCRVRNCVNPAHLEAVPHLVNVRRGRAGKPNAEKTHCPQGHPYAGENLYVYVRRRRCLSCKRRMWREWRARQAT